LAIVKKIIDEHHGSVAIENRPSRGASVSILLPLSKAA
jgi:nitrogen fixation/metabolism regulation signal transduction histidine kinase